MGLCARRCSLIVVALWVAVLGAGCGAHTSPQPAWTPEHAAQAPATRTTGAAVPNPTSTAVPELPPSPAPRPQLTEAATRTPAEPTLTPTFTPTPSLLSPTFTATPPPPATLQPPTSTATPSPSATPLPRSPTPRPSATRTPLPPTAIPRPYQFQPAGPAQADPSHPCPGCPLAPAYIVGHVLDAGGNPVVGVRLVCYNDWHRYPVVASKAGGEYDFAVIQAKTTWYLVVLDPVDQPISPVVSVPFDTDETCRYTLDWRATH